MSERAQLVSLEKASSTSDNRRFSLNSAPIKLNNKNKRNRRREIVKFIRRSAVHPKIIVQSKKLIHENVDINKEPKLTIESRETVKNTLGVNQQIDRRTLQKQKSNKANDSQSLRIQNMNKTMRFGFKSKCSKVYSF